MPLVVLCGIPASGKSRCAKILSDQFAAAGDTVVTISDDSLGFSRDKAYAGVAKPAPPPLTAQDATSEKMVRGAVKAAVERFCSADRIVVVDSLNYIKGFRYELYCVARACATTHCVVNTPPPLCFCAMLKWLAGLC
jgi:protein KTI12